MYATVLEVKKYLNIEGAQNTDDTLIQSLIVAAQQRIEDYTKRKFEASADTVQYYDASCDVDGRYLAVYDDLSHITSISNNGTALPSTEYVTSPRNTTPWNAIAIKSGSTYYWEYTTSPEDAISVTGRWAVMLRRPFTAIARAANVVTATCADTSGIAIGNTVHVAGVADNGFDGAFVVTAVSSGSVTWKQSGSNDTDTTGVILIVPPSIHHACLRLTAWLYRQKDTQSGDADRPIMAGDGNIIMPTTLPQDVQMLLREWVRIL